MLFLLLRILTISISKDIVSYKDQRKDNKYKYKCLCWLWDSVPRTAVYCSHLRTRMKIIVTRRKFCGSGVPVICAVVTATPQTIKDYQITLLICV